MKTKIIIFAVLLAGVWIFYSCSGSSTGSCPACQCDSSQGGSQQEDALDALSDSIFQDSKAEISPGTDSTDMDVLDTSQGRDLMDAEDGAGGKKGFNESCSSNKDCKSGFCIETPWGYVCTKPCVDECPGDWLCRTYQMGSDMVSICTPPGITLCKPCKSDDQCSEGYCVNIGDGPFCGMNCGDNDTCPPGFVCKEVDRMDPDATGLTAKQCVPVTNACDCTKKNAGKTRLCEVKNKYGRCIGTETCDPTKGWIGCDARTPMPEECNGIDDDCNGVADDNPALPADPCENTVPGIGTCKGNWICEGEKGWVCTAKKPEKEICDGKDNNCDGKVDEEWPVGQPCIAGKGECQRAGVNVCNATHDGVVCNATPGEPTKEICDGKDNDCDGQTDEDWPKLGSVCYAGVGACKAAGKYVCNSDGSAITCDAKQGQPQKESCNYIDDDCDGKTDEDFKDASGLYVNDKHCGNCFTDCTAIWNPATTHANGHCHIVGGQPTCYFSCEKGYADADGNPENGCELYIDPEAVYVSVPEHGGSNSNSCGAWNNPCGSISYGISRAASLGKKKVLVSEGIYNESVVLKNGISLLGGYSSVTWERKPDTYITVIQGHSPAGQKHKKAVIAQNITSHTEFSGFTVYGENNFYQAGYEDGGNSYGLYIVNSTGALVIKNNNIYAGRGSKGSDGAKGADGANGGNGGNGLQGADHSNYNNCGGYRRRGGAGGFSRCGANGGNGGDAVCPHMNNQEPSGSSGSGPGHGVGGKGGYDRYLMSGYPYNCTTAQTGGVVASGTNGTDGRRGTDGSAGRGCTNAYGRLINSEWTPDVATDGGRGTPGGGGGGGGAGGGLDARSKGCGNQDTYGGSGGGGGAGGCGGTGGKAGKGGGASIAVFIIWTKSGHPSSIPVLSNNLIVRNQGGKGGNGGNGGIGGIGGNGGAGGPVGGSGKWTTGKGGHGGRGGDGGHGGGGGGGCGGASFGVYTYHLGNGATAYCSSSSNKFAKLGDGGAGGHGGSSNGHAGSNGAQGASSNCSIH